MNLDCYICKETDLVNRDKGVWAFHDDLPPKTDLAICARCWWFDENPKLHYNGNLNSEDYGTHFPSTFHDGHDNTIWATMPILYRKGDVCEVKIIDEKKDNLEMLDFVVKALEDY